jgi:3-methyladenine DNA glycosylase AlkD
MHSAIRNHLYTLKNKRKARDLERFFKCGKGEYGEGDVFLGIMVPDQRKIAKKHYKEASLDDVQKLLKNKYHECRLTALLILVHKFEKANKKEQKRMYNFYLKNLRYINNWDLVDVTTPKIVGVYILENPEKKGTLLALAQSQNLWKRRVAILATFAFIKNERYDEALRIAKILVDDEHDLIHKSVGWMLREVGNRNRRVEEKFLKKHYKTMPRTMLRYAIEKFPERKRQYYMKK